MRSDATALKTEPSLSGRTKHISVLLRSEESRVELASALKDVSGADFFLLLRPTSMGGPFGRTELPPDVLLIEIDPSRADDINYLRALKATPMLAHTPIVALSDSAKHLAAIGAIRAGADDVVLTPINRSDLLEVLGRVTGSVSQPGTLGRLVVFAHVSGGAGATTLAVNSAAAIAESGKADGVCLLDLDVQYGNAASLLDIQKVSPVDVLIDEPARLDREMLESMLIPHAGGISVLTAPKMPFALGSYRSEMVANLLQLAKRRYSIVVADLPVALAPWTDVVLREAAVVFIVCTPNVTAVHRLVQFLRLMEREHLSDLPYRIVLNRHHASGEGGDISPQRFAKAVGRPVDYTIPNDYRLVSVSHNQGKPAVSLGSSSRFAQQLTTMLSAELGGSILKPIERPWWQLGGK
jgi:pilus assembly protein CpaE